MVTATADTVTVATGDVIKMDTPAQATNDTTLATTAHVKLQRLHDFTAPVASVGMNSQVFTSLGAGTLNGHSLRYEQLFTTGNVTLLGQLTVPNGVRINGVAPSYATIADNRYPGSRPLYIYVKKAHLTAIFRKLGFSDRLQLGLFLVNPEIGSRRRH